MKPESVVCWLWQPSPGYRSQFTYERVNTLARMVKRHYPHPHRFICVTDIPRRIDPSIEVVKAWNDYAEIPSPHGGHNPSCYRRLRAFHPEVGAALGKRFVSLDLDTVVVGDVTPLWDRPEDFVIWGETNPKSFYNGSMFLLTAGARSQVWKKFNPRTSPREAKAAGKFGSDQGFISFILGKGEATWTTSDGVYSYNVHLRNNGTKLPQNARMVMWHGAQDPWGHAGMALPWVQEHYR